MKSFALYILLLVPCYSFSQIVGMETAWTNEFKEWNIYAVDKDGEAIEGQIRMRWAINNDWSEWDYRIGEDFGQIKVKWKGNFNQWELRGGNEIIDIQTIYKDDATQWRIRTSDEVLRLELNRRDVPFDWRVNNDKYGFYEVYTEWERDPNAWTIVDEFSAEVSIHVKMAILFFSTFSSTLP